ncbi:hypothetical protein Scep_011490 [Stephania cephalantha]|uniref:AAA+ ATPase domain-containing protein n=1 Tax=Stephania cephalantha TaxID=152367 RepID=A0AAP0P5L7_9MAGN
MGKSRGPRRCSAIDHLLIRRIKSSKLINHDIDDVVDGLRSRFPEYQRLKTLPFKSNVRKALEQPQFKADEFDDSDSAAAAAAPRKRMRLKKSDESEERLLVREREHLRRRREPRRQSPSSSSSGEEEENGAVSTSEDAIFDEKVEPEFDLMKTMLRASYGAPKKGNEERNLEVEVGSKREKIDLVNGDGEGIEGKRKLQGLGGGIGGVGGGVHSGEARGLKSGDGGDVKGKDGPRFRDIGGMQGVLNELIMEVIFPLYHPQVPRWLGVKPMAGILFHGPPGCGKTKLAHAIANETGVPFYKISATEVVSGVSGESEENIRDLFSKAYRTAPSIVFIDEIDAIASKRESLQREMERRIVTQLMTCMDESHQVIGSNDGDSDSGVSNQKPGYVLVVGATNRPDALDPALRRRFDREILLSVPDENARTEILTVLTSNIRLEGEFELYKIARATPGFVGADLASLVNKAGNLAMRRIVERRKSELFGNLNDQEWWKHPWIPEEMEGLSITMADFESLFISVLHSLSSLSILVFTGRGLLSLILDEAAKIVQPSARREGFSTIPNVKWEDVGGLDSLRKEFDRYIVSRIKNPEDYEEFGVDLETGFLLYGPPGCGKTLIAKAVANEAGANFIHIKGPELLNKYVGESELAVRTIFSRARTCSPCILFFDEVNDRFLHGLLFFCGIVASAIDEMMVDALATKRGTEGGWVVERLLNQLLIELDGADQRRGVYVIGATNRPKVMDEAVLRPGRFGKHLYVPLPGPNERGLILKALARKKPISPDVNLISIGWKKACENLSGADMAAVLNEAAMAALEEKRSLGEGSFDRKAWTINEAHFDRALEKISPSVSEKQNSYYKDLSQSFRAA